MDARQIIEIAASVPEVWAVMTDVERWSEWTDSIDGVEILGGEALDVGGRALVRQPKLPDAVWQVTEWDHERYFEWRSRVPGLKTIGGHMVEPLGEGSRVTLSLAWRGFLAPLVRLLYRNLTRRYVEMEAQGLKKRCETGSARFSASDPKKN